MIINQPTLLVRSDHQSVEILDDYVVELFAVFHEEEVGTERHHYVFDVGRSVP